MRFPRILRYPSPFTILYGRSLASRCLFPRSCCLFALVAVGHLGCALLVNLGRALSWSLVTPWTEDDGGRCWMIYWSG